jgi:hypothetical protein
MKRFWLLIIFILGSQFAFSPANATTSNVVRLVTEPNRNLSGFFYSDDLVTRLAPTGDLGKLVFNPSIRPRTWVVDVAFIEDVIAMSTEYKIGLPGGERIDGTGSTVAINWLNQFKFITVNDPIIVLPYGNPDFRVVKRYAPGELNFYYAGASQKLSEFLGRSVRSDRYGFYSVSKLKDTYALRSKYSEIRRSITQIEQAVDAPELRDLRLQISRLLNPQITNELRARLIKNAYREEKLANRSLKVISGRYRITSSSSKLPITLVNDFSVPVKVNLKLTPRNSRVQIESVKGISLPAESRIQLAVELDVITPGTATVGAQLTDLKGNPITKKSNLFLNLSVVDSRVAWFTSSAAIILFLAATAQTVRRIRRSRK